MTLFTPSHSFRTCGGSRDFTVGHDLVCPQPQFYDMWWFWCFTGGMTLFTPSHSFKTCGDLEALQGAWHGLPPATVLGDAVVLRLCRGLDLVYLQSQLYEMWWCWGFAGGLTLFTPSHSLRRCGGPEALQGAWPCLPPAIVIWDVVVLRLCWGLDLVYP